MENTKDLPHSTVELGNLPDAPEDRLLIVESLTTAYLRDDKVDEAKSVLRDYVEGEKQQYGEESLESICALRNCAVLLGKHGKYAEAEPFLRDFSAKTAEFSDGSNEYTRWGRITLGYCLSKTKQFEEANHILRDLLEEQKQILKEKDPETLETIKYYLQSLLESRKSEEAVGVLAYCRQLIENIDDDDDDEVKVGILEVGCTLLDHQKCRMGQDIIHGVLARQRDLFGPEHRETVRMVELACSKMLSIVQGKLQGRMGTSEHFVLILRNRWNEMKEFLGETHVDTISALEVLADIAWGDAKNEGTLLLSRKVFDARKQTLGDDHQDTVSARDTLWSRMRKLHYPEAPSIGGDEAAEQAHVMESVNEEARDANNKATPMSTILGSRNSEDKGSQGSRNADQLCKFCCELDTASYLGSAQVYHGLKDSSYPSGEQTAQELLSRQDCPLCQLIFNGFSTQLRVQLSQLDSITKVSYKYIRPETLESDFEEGFSRQDSIKITADMLLLEVSMQQQGCIWINAVETGGGYMERVETLADASLVLNSPYEGGLSLTEYDIVSAISLLSRERQDELRNKLALLGDKYGYLKGRLVSELADPHLLKTWIHCCDWHHGKDCQPIEMKQDSHWRPTWLIDVDKDMLVPGNKGGEAVRYAALSYVWGDRSVKQLKHTATGGVSGRLKLPGGLMNSSRDILPTTIKDAMELCRKIGVPYLWVDAICLDQDNITDDILDTMGKIYQGAYVTIVAGAGQNSWAGLSGIGRRRRPHQQWCSIGNMSLGLYLGSRKATINSAKWFERAWTFQEMILSKRLLIFTENEVLYQCGSGMAWRESVFLEHPELLMARFSIASAECKSSQISLAIEETTKGDKSNKGKSRIRGIYRGIVNGYLHREMTDSSDVLKALQGILTIVTERTEEAFHQGILVEDAFRSLFFNVTGSPQSLRRPDFPSWSWCGWQNIKAVDDASTPGLKFIETLEHWFEPEADIYRLGSSEDSGNNDACEVYSFSAIGGQNNEAERCQIQSDAKDKGAAWGEQINKMLVFSADTMNIEVAGQGQSVPWDPEMRRYSVLSPGLGLEFLDLNKDWREKQSAHLEFVAFGRAKAFDDEDVIMFEDEDGNRPEKGAGSLTRMGWEGHLVALVAVLLVETDPATGISQRLGLYQVEEECWDRAVKTRRRLYLC